MASDLILNLGENITLKVREEISKHSFDHHWLCPLNAFIIFSTSVVILIVVLADSLHLSKKQSDPNLTALIRLLTIATYSECLLGRCLSIVFAIVYVYEPPHYILCRLSAVSSIFAVILESLCIGCFVVPKFCRITLRLWLFPIMALGLTSPILVLSSHISVRYIISRNACSVVGDFNIYYTVTVLLLVFLPSWSAMFYYCVTYKCNKCPTAYTGIDERRNKDGRFGVLLIVLYLMLVVPNIITITINGLIKFSGNGSVDGTKFDIVTTWMVCLFWYFWPSLALFMYPSLCIACKSFLLDCKSVRTIKAFTSARNINCNNISPILMATGDGLLLRDVQGVKQIDLTMISDISSKSSSQPTTRSISIKPEVQQGQNKKMVRFAYHVTQIPETSNVYHSLPTYHSSASSSSTM